jgi:hypothetical protein
MDTRTLVTRRYRYVGYSPVQVGYDVVTLRREGYSAYEEIDALAYHILIADSPSSFINLLAGNGLIYMPLA